MMRKKMGMGILAIALVFGMTIIGCDGGLTNGSENGNGNQNGNGSENGNGNQNGNGTENDNGNENGSGTENDNENGNGTENDNNNENGDGNENGNGNNNDNSNNTGKLVSMNIVNASNLFIAPSGTSSRNIRSASDSSVNTLFKVTDDGYIQEVIYSYENEDGNSVASTEILSPTSIVVLNQNYLIIGFGYNNNYLVNSNTGACYIYTNDLPNTSQNNTNYRGEYIGENGNGDIYFISSQGGYEPVRRLSITNIDNVNITTVSAPNDSVLYFGVDSGGNIGYEGMDSGNNRVLRYRKSGGGIEVLPGQVNYSHTTFWTGFNGKLYYYNPSNLGAYIKEISSESSYSVIDYGTNDWSPFNWGIGLKGLLKIKTKNRIIAYNDSGVIELYNDQTNTATGIPIDAFGLASIKLGIASDNYYYLAGTSTGTPKSVLIKVDPLDNTYETLINGNYDIYKMTVDNDEVVTFNALQMSNAAIVVGQISTPTNIAILDVTLTSELTVLERIR